MNRFIGTPPACIAVAAILVFAGCGVDQRITNQGGGNVLTAVTKFQSDQLTDLTPDEVQILSDTISQLSPDINVTLNDDQAAAITDFLVANGVNSFADAETLVNAALADPDAVVLPDGFLEQIETIDVDLEALGNLDIGSLDFSNLLGPASS